MTADERQRRYTGGCQCGAVRFAFYAEPVSPTICHCRMCQKALGNFFGPFAGVARKDFAFTRGAPKLFRSSDVVTRGFCEVCGTPLTFAYDDADKIEIAIGAFDEPARIVPVAQLEPASAVPYFGRLPHLPVRTDGPEYDAQRRLIATSNRQHPDHDTKVWPVQRPAGAAR